MSAVAITTLVAAQATHVIPYVHSLTPVGDGQVEIVYSPVVNEKVQSRKRETKLVSIDNILCYRLDEKPAKSFVTLISDSYVVNTNKDGYEIDENGFIVMCGTCYSPKHYIPTVTAPVGNAAGDDTGDDAGDDTGAGDAAAEAPAEKPAGRGRGRTAAATAKAATPEDKPATASRRAAAAATAEVAAESQAEKPAGRGRGRTAVATPVDEAAEATAEKPAGRTRTRAAAAETPAEKPATTRGRRSAGWTTRGE